MEGNGDVDAEGSFEVALQVVVYRCDVLAIPVLDILLVSLDYVNSCKAGACFLVLLDALETDGTWRCFFKHVDFF